MHFGALEDNFFSFIILANLKWESNDTLEWCDALKIQFIMVKMVVDQMVRGRLKINTEIPRTVHLEFIFLGGKKIL